MATVVYTMEGSHYKKRSGFYVYAREYFPHGSQGLSRTEKRDAIDARYESRRLLLHESMRNNNVLARRNGSIGSHGVLSTLKDAEGGYRARICKREDDDCR